MAVGGRVRSSEHADQQGAGAKYTNLPVEQVVGNCAYIDPDGKLDVGNVDNQIKWLQSQGFVDKGFNADAIVAKEFVKPD